MKKMILVIISLMVGSVCAQFFIEPEEDKLSPRAQKFINTGAKENRAFVIYFTDKNVFDQKGLEKALSEVELDKKTFQRRYKTFRRENDLVLFSDLPVNESYIEKLGLDRIRTTSKWFNFVSAEISAEKALDLSQHKFVRKIDILPKKGNKPVIEQRETKETVKDDFYGYSYNQVNQINIPAAHNIGYTGQGVRLLIIDTGYNKNHEVFDSLTVVDEWDFIYNDGETGNDANDLTDQEGHGTACWSIAAGYNPGTYVGPAYGSDFLLAKTEDYLNESTLEEDYLVAALEWGEARGADVATISLGYSEFDDPAENYTYEDMNGQTAISTLGAKRAAYLGMIIVNSLGNSGNSTWKYLTAPSDADSILACGAIESNGIIASFSSYGPSYDGRIKPDVVARGVSNNYARSTTTDQYNTGSGTSFSAPLIAGAACIVLSANPEWTNMQVREALMMTADRASNPDSTRYGWGLINALDAVNYIPVGLTEEYSSAVSDFHLYQNYPNPFNPMTQISFGMPGPGDVKLMIFDIKGRELEVLVDSYTEKGTHFISFDASKYSNGTFFYSLSVNGETVAAKRMIFVK